jgi:hypothetical protein
MVAAGANRNPRGAIARQTVATALARAQRNNALVRIARRRVETWHFDAYIIETGTQLVAIQPVRERLDFDGLEILRLLDISHVQLAPNRAFLAIALSRHRRHRASAGGIELASARALLESLASRRVVVAVHRELDAPDVCEIGLVVRVDSDTYSLLEITPDARVERGPRRYALSDVTRIQIGTQYQETLAAFAKAELRSRLRGLGV